MALMVSPTRVRRAMQIARLTARRGTGWAKHQWNRRGRAEAERAELDQQFAIQSAEDVAAELGQMKGAAMKLGQMLSAQLSGLPPAAQQALATLQADVPPMAPSLAEQVVTEDLGRHPTLLFADWNPEPTAAASIGQVHRARLHDGTPVAVKVQYPGAAEAIETDLANAKWIHRILSAVALRGLDVDELLGELRARMREELNYELEAERQQRFAERYADHPFVRIPEVVPDRSSRRVLTTTWATGEPWPQWVESASETDRQWLGEALFRFTQGSLYWFEEFHGDPHPGNFFVHTDPESGARTLEVLDFGMVKAWRPGETDLLWSLIDPVLADDAAGAVRCMIDAGFLAPDHGLSPDRIWAWVKAPYLPFQQDRWAYTPDFTGNTLATMLDPRGPYADVMNQVTMPASFVVLDRVVWGMSALLGSLGAENGWRAMLAEYRRDAAPTTPMGVAEADWRQTRGHSRP